MSKARTVADFLPLGGQTNEGLIKASAADFDFAYGAVGGGTGLPPSTVADAGKALVVDAAGVADWGEDIDSAAQTINAGTF